MPLVAPAAVMIGPANDDNAIGRCVGVSTVEHIFGSR